MVDMAVKFSCVLAGHLLHLLRSTLPSPRLHHVHVKRLLALLQGTTAAAATAVYQRPVWLGGAPSSSMVWLAGQPEAVAAAAELGLTAADVPDPAAAVLLFGGQRDEADAQLMT
jgi:hypothetical protein